jgi:hypothetical protein
MFTVLPMRCRVILFFVLGLPPLASAGLTWETRKISGVAPPGAREVVTEFAFKNTGPSPVTIRAIETDCECTLAELARRTYAPGESGAIKTTLTVGNRTGLQEHTITVLTDEPVAGKVELALRIHIPAVLTFSIRMLYWKAGSTAEEASIEVSSAGQVRLARIELQEIKPAQAAKVRLESVQPGNKYRLHVRPADTSPGQSIAIHCLATLADGMQHPFTVHALVQ